MNSKSKLLPLVLVALAFLFLPVFAFAQESAPAAVDPVVPVTATNVLLDFFLQLAAKYPVIATFISVLGSMRLWAKPAVSLVYSIVQATPTKYDDGLWAKIFDFFTLNPVGKFLAYLLDWFASIKVVPPSTPEKRST